jgi:hypothetical protein
MAFERVLVLGAEGEGNVGVIIEDTVVLAGAGVLEVEAFKGGTLFVTEAEPSLSLLVQCEVAPTVVGPWWRDAFAVNQVDLVAVAEGGRTLLEGTLLDVVERALATEWGSEYGDSLEASKRYDLGKE